MKKEISILFLAATAILTSCTPPDPEYEKYKAEKAAQEIAAQQVPTHDPYAIPQDTQSATDPYGAPATNPYDTTAGSTTPYQSLPPLPGNPNVYQNSPTQNSLPTGGYSGSTHGRVITHTVQKGDTIWGLSKQYNVSQSDILASNGLSSNTIIIGQQLQIPQP